MKRVVINAGDARKFINKEGQRMTKEVVQSIIDKSRALSMKMQNEMNEAIDKGPVPFTKRSVLFFYSKTNNGVKNTIMIKDVQAKYLYEILVKPEMIDKIVPTSAARLDRFGNIAGLKRNLSNGRYKVVKQGTKERLIDTNAKKKDKRVIGLREEKRRKMVYDFYRNGEKGAMLIIKDIKGTFKVKRG